VTADWSQFEIGRDEIGVAAVRIAGHVRETPVLRLEADALGVPAILKLDLLQPTGSFKVRGAFSLLLAAPIPGGGVTAASGGNFGAAVAYAAGRLGVAATIFVPASSPREKIDALAALGAEVRVIDGYYPAALAACREWAAERDVLFAHAYDQREVVAGQGTCGRELAAQAPEVDTVLVAVGGGGLIGGIASWYRDDARIVSVETEGTPTLHAALAAGEPVDVEIGGIAASSLGASRVGDHPWAAARRWVDRAVLVSDEALTAARRRLWQTARLAVEPGAAAPVAALLSGAYGPEPGERVAVVVCGANADPRDLIAPAR